MTLPPEQVYPEITTKNCKKCHFPKPLNAFYKKAPHSGYKDNRDSQCKACRSTYRKTLHLKLKSRSITTDTERICNKCGGKPQPIENYAKYSSKRGGRSTICKTCEKKRYKEWRNEHREEQLAKQKAYYRREINQALKWSKEKRFKRFGVNREWYDKTIASQNNCCAICGTTDPKGFGGRFAIDHNHNCCPSNRACDKCRRGLLCFPCNARLAHLESNWIKKATIYLATHSSKDL